MADISEVEEYHLDDADAAFVAYGFTARSALSAAEDLRREGLKVGLLRLKTLWPFPAESIERLGRRVRTIVVPEMNLGQMVQVVTSHVRCPVVPFNQMDGTVIYPSPLVDAMRRALT